MCRCASSDVNTNKPINNCTILMRQCTPQFSSVKVESPCTWNWPSKTHKNAPLSRAYTHTHTLKSARGYTFLFCVTHQTPVQRTINKNEGKSAVISIRLQWLKKVLLSHLSTSFGGLLGSNWRVSRREVGERCRCNKGGRSWIGLSVQWLLVNF